MVYLRGHEGRGIGLVPRSTPTRCRTTGRDTVQANLDLGLPADRREYGAAAAILAELGLDSVRLLTNNPAKVDGAQRRYGIGVAETFPIEVGRTPENAAYLATKREAMGHLLTADGGTPVRGPGGPRRARSTARGTAGRRGGGQLAHHVMDGLVEGALGALREAGVELAESDVIRVPGSFELPVAAARLASAGVDAVVALGVVIRGGTPHFDYVCQAATSGLTQVAVSTGVPVGFGLLTCDDEQQALDRAGLPGSREDKGAEAAQAAVATVLALRAIVAPA